jgi:hypothetical protein
VLNQIKMRVNGLRKLAHMMEFKMKLMVANGIVMSKLAYGIAVWGGCQGYLRKALQVQQLNAARAVCGYKSYYWSREKLLRTCGWCSVNQLYWEQVLRIAHVATKERRPSGLHEAMKPRHSHMTRAAAGASRSNLSKASFNNAATEYARVPENIKMEGNAGKFKKKLKRWVLANIAI